MAPKLPGLSLSESQFSPYLDEHEDDEGHGIFGGKGGLGGARGGLGGLGGLGGGKGGLGGLGGLGGGKGGLGGGSGLGGLGGGRGGLAGGGGLGGLGGGGEKSGLGGLGRGGGRSGLGGFGGGASGSGLGGLGGLGKQKSQTSDTSSFAGRGKGKDPKQSELSFGMAGLTLRPPEKAVSSAAHDRLINEQIKAMQELTKVVDGLADRTIEGFKNIAEKLNPKLDHSYSEAKTEQEAETSVKHSVDLIVENISSQLESRPNSAYIIIPGHEYSTDVGFDSIKELIESRTITIVGDISTLTHALNEGEDPDPLANDDDDDDDDDDQVKEHEDED